MQKPTLTIFFQFNPWRSSLGGIQTIIRSFIKYAPDTFNVRLVGTGTEQTPAKKGWQDMELEGRSLQFLPLFDLPDDNHRRLIPTTVRYTAALLRHEIFHRDCASDFMHFHRLEPTIASQKWRGEKTFFLHNDIQQHITAKDGSKAILWRRFPKAYFALERQLFQQFDHILSCNSDSIAFYQSRYPMWHDRIEYIKNSFDSEVFYPVSETARQTLRHDLIQDLQLPADREFILFAGRIHPQKDPLLLLESFAQVTHPQAHLLMAGDGELMPEVRAKITALGLESRVSLLGPLPQARLAALHRLSRVFVLSSAFEGLPLVALETLASGTPLVTTHTGETPKLLQANTGIVCPDRSAPSLAAAIDRVLYHPDEFPRDACIRSMQPYGAKTIVESTYEGMLMRWQQRINPSGDGVKQLTTA
jgi:glycosyltransferase involved in cell wall biosynthesis